MQLDHDSISAEYKLIGRLKAALLKQVAQHLAAADGSSAQPIS
jgi:hypothetical protein